MTVFSGVLWSLGAALCWGSHLVFVKLDCVKKVGIRPIALTLFYAIGLFTASVVAMCSSMLTGSVININSYGLTAGAIYGFAKLLMILAVTDVIGIAMGTAVANTVNVCTAFLAGLCTGESAQPLQLFGLFLLVTGLVVVASPGMIVTGKTFNSAEIALVQDCKPSSSKSKESTPLLQPTVAGGDGMIRCIYILVLAGVGYGVQALPFKLSGGDDAFSYAISLAIGQLFVVLGAFTLTNAVASKTDSEELPNINLETYCTTGIPAGFAGGLLLFSAAYCNSKAVQEIGLIGSTLGQLNMVIAGMWGIAVFKEIQDATLISLFFGGTLLAISGAGFLIWR